MANNEKQHADSVVIIPMYNEKENAAAIIDAVMALPTAFDILVIDDNSPDGTASIVKGQHCCADVCRCWRSGCF